jgi:SET domain-containing protein
VSKAIITHFLSPKLEARPHPEAGGYGVFARQPVQAGELLTVWGGQVVNLEQLRQLPESNQHHAVQVEEGLYLAPIGPGEPADYFNHSCSPNAGLRGQIALVAMRDIQPDEEVCFDYAMTDGTPYDEFECACGSAHCRQRITGDDWKKPDLWERYAGYFSPYLQRRIDRLRAARH